MRRDGDGGHVPELALTPGLLGGAAGSWGLPPFPPQVLSGLCQADAPEGGRELDQLHPEENHFQRSAVRRGAAPRPRPLRSPHCAPRHRPPRGSPRLSSVGSPPSMGGVPVLSCPAGPPGLPLPLSFPLTAGSPPPRPSPRPSPPGSPRRRKARAGPNKELFNFLFYLTPASAAFVLRPGGELKRDGGERTFAF